MKKIFSDPSHSRNIALPALLLAAVLAVLFWRSFLPDYVHFSNDGPLGAQNVDYAKLPGAASGQWDDLNDTGFNAGPYSPGPSPVLKALLGPVGYSKFYAPVALFILGLGAFTFFRSLKLSPLAAALGALAVMLNTGYFAGACWGIASLEIAIGFDFLALALIVANRDETPWHIRWTRLALAGLCVGVNVMEAADVGALSSLFIAAFLVFKTFADENGPVVKNAFRSAVRVAVVAIFAGFIATQTVVSLVSTNIEGVAGTAQDADAKAKQWDWATQWSLPKLETLGIVVPGLFGYRGDTPNEMQPKSLAEAYRGGVYWGGMGRSPVLDRYFDNGSEGPEPSGPGIGMRFGYAGYYCGILVALAAIWAIMQSFRRQGSPFSAEQKKFIWFWVAVVVISLPLAWGRFAPFSKTSNDLMFYALLYHLPYFSTIRSPSKFLVFFFLALPVLFAYGIHALNCRYLEGEPAKPPQKKAVARKWDAFDRKWVFACAGIFGASVLGWLFYAAQKPDLVQYLQKVGFDENTSDINFRPSTIAAFSLGQVGWFLVIFAFAFVLLTLVVAGFFSGPRARLGGILLGTLLVFDLGRANLPFIIHWNYKLKYEIGSLNPIEKFLSKKSYEHRVVGLPFGAQQQLRGYDNYFGGNNGIYSIEWTQQHFLYYNIQCLDVIQMPRTAENLQAYLEALSPRGTLESLPLLTRHWELTNTRYLLGAAGFLDVMNQQLDPVQHRFRIAKRFDIVAKPGITQPSGLEELTAQTNDTGDLAVFEFTGALPRAKLYTDWQTNSSDLLKNFSTNNLGAEDLHIFDEAGTNGFLTLKKLASASFDPQQTVLLDAPLPEGNPSGSTNENSGTVEFTSYAPEHIVFAANAVAPSVLLLNDKYDPNWHVTVDGKPAELLRCNFIMRGVYLPPGAHTVKFDFSLPNKPLYVTLTAMGFGLCLVIFLVVALKRESSVKR